MAVPEDIRNVPRPTNTVVEARVSKSGEVKYIVRCRIGTDYRDGKSRPINGGIIGYIIDGEYVARAEPGPIEPDEVDMQTWAVERLALDLSKDVIDDLRKVYDEKDSEMLYTMAILRVRNPKLKDCRMRRDYKESMLSETFPSLPMSKTSVSDFLQRVGGARLRNRRFLKLRVARVEKGANIAVDGMLVQDTSTVDNLGAISRKRRPRGGMDIVMIYAYDIDTRDPVCYDVYEGNLLDSKTYGDFIESNDLRDVLLVGDKAFTENAAKPQFSSDRNLGFMFPIRRNAAAIRRFDLRAYDGFLNSHPSVTYKVAHDVGEGVWYYSFRDSDRASQEEKAFLAQLRKSGKGLDPDKLASMKGRWGTVVYKSNREMTPEQAYSIYLDRWMLEQMFDLYKNILELDETRVHSDLSDFGTSLVNFLSTLITSRIIRHLFDKKVLDDRSYDDARDILGKTLRFRNEDGTWTYRALAENDKVVLRQLDLIPKLPPKRGPGRPRKSV